MIERIRVVGIALSQLLHVVATLGAGDPKMTTSARIGRQVARGERWAEIADWVISTLLWDHPDHCLRAYYRDRTRRMQRGQHDY